MGQPLMIIKGMFCLVSSASPNYDILIPLEETTKPTTKSLKVLCLTATSLYGWRTPTLLELLQTVSYNAITW